jgi:hypothetical protein
MRSLSSLALVAVVVGSMSAAAFGAAAPHLNKPFEMPGVKRAKFVVSENKLGLKAPAIKDAPFKDIVLDYTLAIGAFKDSPERMSQWLALITPEHMERFVASVQKALETATTAEKLEMLRIADLFKASTVWDHKSDAVANSLVMIFKSAKTADEFNQLAATFMTAEGLAKNFADNSNARTQELVRHALLVSSQQMIELGADFNALAKSAPLQGLYALIPHEANGSAVKDFQAPAVVIARVAREVAAKAGATETAFFAALAKRLVEAQDLKGDEQTAFAVSLGNYWKLRVDAGTSISIPDLSKDENFMKVLKWSDHKLLKDEAGNWTAAQKQTFGEWFKGLLDKILKFLRLRRKAPEFNNPGADI